MEASRIIAISVAALLAIAFFAERALPYLLLERQAIARYEAHRVWLLMHVAGGAVAVLVGPLQLGRGIARRGTSLHRRLGIAYVTAVAIGSVSAFYLASHTPLGWVFAIGITGLGIAWVVTTTMAVVAIRRGRIEQHHDWTIR